MASYPAITSEDLDRLNDQVYPAITPENLLPQPIDQSPASNQYINSPMDPLGSMGLTLDDILKMKPKEVYPSIVPQMSQQDLMNFDKSVNAANIKSAAQPIEVPEITSSSPTPSLEDDEMKQALADKRNNQAMLMIAQGAHTAGMSLAGVKPNEEYTKQFQELASAPVEDIKTLRKSLGEKLTLDEQKAMYDPNSQASQVQRKAMRDMLSKIGYKSLSDKITDDMSAKQVQSIMGNLNIQNLMQQYETMQNRKEIQAMKQTQLKEAAAGKLDDKDTKRLDQANKTIQAELARNNTAFGRNANIVRSANALETLISTVDPKDINERQIFEIAAGLDAMLSSGASTVSGRQHLIPSSWAKDKAKIAEYLTNRPKGAGQEAFVKQMMETVAREKAVAQQQLQQSSRKALASYSDLKKRHPEVWNFMLKQNELPEDIFETDQNVSTQPVSGQVYDARTESGIKAFMAVHPELSREEAIQILKNAKKIN